MYEITIYLLAIFALITIYYRKHFGFRSNIPSPRRRMTRSFSLAEERQLAAAFESMKLANRRQSKTNAVALSDTIVRTLQRAPGPIQFPIFGSLHIMGKYDVPFQAFTELAKEYGDIFSIKLGSTQCLVVNNVELIREVLNQNGKFFSGRPDFIRFHKLFAGDRNNSLALCDWSNLQLKRRNLARRHCGPRQHSDNYKRLGEVATFETIELLATLEKKSAEMYEKGSKEFQPKSILSTAAMNMFAHYMCSTRFDADSDKDFKKMVEHFDEIFWEINQGYAVDFLPWLAPFYESHMNKLSGWSSDIRAFILSRIIDKREASLDLEAPERDFTDGLLKVLHDDSSVNRDTIIFMLEDFLGGHSSISNLVMLTLAACIKNPEVGQKVREEIDKVILPGKMVNLEDKEHLPYTDATILECLRYASSPIVPHVATENACVAGYGVEKGTVVFINNYELNTSEKYWTEPSKYDPQRFLEKVKSKARTRSETDSGMESDHDKIDEKKDEKKEIKEKEVFAVKKNIPHFFPFSIGKRTCIGQTLVKSMSFVMFANIMKEFYVTCEDFNSLKSRPACVALPTNTFSLEFIPRKKTLE